MTESLSRIFKDRLYKTAKNPDRNWEMIANRAGPELMAEVHQLFPHPEIALCAITYVTAELVLLQPDDFKRRSILDNLKRAVEEQMKKLETEQAEGGYEQEEPDEPEEEVDIEEEEGEEEEEDPEEEEPKEKDEDKKPGTRPGTSPREPSVTEEPEGDTEEEEYDIDAETDYEKKEEEEEEEVKASKNPARMAGYRRKRRNA